MEDFEVEYDRWKEASVRGSESLLKALQEFQITPPENLNIPESSIPQRITPEPSNLGGSSMGNLDVSVLKHHQRRDRSRK